MTESPLKSQAISLLSKLNSTASKLKQESERIRALEAAGGSDWLAKKKLGEQTLALKAYRDWLKPESAISTANPKQLLAAEAFWRKPRPAVTTLIGANQSGKTWCAGRMCFIRHLRDEAKPGSIYWCVAPNFEKSVAKQQDEFWNGCPQQLLGGATFDRKNGFGQQRPTLIIDPKDRKIVVRFKTAAQWDDDPRSFESETLDGVWIDESIPEELHDALMPRLVAKGGFMLYSTIPDVEWMHERFEEDQSGTVAYIKLAIMDNAQNLDAGVIDNMMATMSEDDKKMRLFGDFRFLSGLVYKEFDKNRHVCEPFRIPAYWPKWRAMDWGNASPTACVWVAMSPNGTMYVYREYYEKGTTAKTDAECITEASQGEKYQSKVIIDPAAFTRNQANMGSIADELQKHGLPCQPGIRTNTVGHEATVQRVRNWLCAVHPDGSPMFQVFDTCKNLISEFRKWKYKVNRLGKVDEADKFEKKNDHALDALRYLICHNPYYKDDEALTTAMALEY